MLDKKEEIKFKDEIKKEEEKELVCVGFLVICYCFVVILRRMKKFR